MGTFGSLTARMFGPVLRAAAAQARDALLNLAAEKFGAPTQKLVLTDGVIHVAAEPRRRVSFGELSRGAKIASSVGTGAVLRRRADLFLRLHRVLRGRARRNRVLRPAECQVSINRRHAI
jgi:nicotinate dehydrogenase subunit B